jgi:hypothetical protein
MSAASMLPGDIEFKPMNMPLIQPGDIEFNPTGRPRYKLDGIPLPGCTTITGILAKEQLLPWAAREAAEYFRKSVAENRLYTPEELDDICEKAKFAHVVKKESAGDIGTATHAWIENYIKNKNAAPLVMPTDPHVLRCVTQFLDFCKSRSVRWLESEIRVASRRYKFGGTFDAIAEIDGVLYLVDFKTSSGIYYEAYLQTAGYTIAIEEMANLQNYKIQNRLILHLNKKTKNFTAKVIQTPLELDRRCFIAMAEVYHLTKNAERILKEIEAWS